MVNVETKVGIVGNIVGYRLIRITRENDKIDRVRQNGSIIGWCIGQCELLQNGADVGLNGEFHRSHIGGVRIEAIVRCCNLKAVAALDMYIALADGCEEHESHDDYR